jgi:preprotein translocase subunit YajC
LVWEEQARHAKITGFNCRENPCHIKNFRLESPMISTAFAQGAAAAPTGGDTLMGMLPIVLMFVILYFLMIRPQMKRAKEHKTMLEGIQKGDEVVAVGFLGKVTKVGPNYVGLEIADNVVIQVEKQGISKLLPKGTIKDAL